jgi:DNA-binding MarR family transcriptional regulator
MEEGTLLETLRKLLASDEGRPEGILPVDLLLVARLLLQRADERPVYTSQSTLARELNCTERTVSGSAQRLKAAGWIEVETGQARWNANKYFVLLAKLPLEESLRRTIVSTEARKLAADYMSEQRKAKPKRIFRRGTEQRYAFRLQSLIDKCDGNEGLLRLILRFALRSENFRTIALRGPHHIRRCWKSLRRDYEAAQKVPKEKELKEQAA